MDQPSCHPARGGPVGLTLHGSCSPACRALSDNAPVGQAKGGSLAGERRGPGRTVKSTATSLHAGRGLTLREKGEESEWLNTLQDSLEAARRPPPSSYPGSVGRRQQEVKARDALASCRRLAAPQPPAAQAYTEQGKVR